MARKRNKENAGLPKRWRYTRNAYYYQVPVGEESSWDFKKTFRLGKTSTEAYVVWAERQVYMDKAKTVAELLDRYALEVVPQKKVSTQLREVHHVRKLREVFGHMPLKSLKPQHIYQYNDKRSQKITREDGKVTGGATTARHEIAVLKHAYTKAVEWGYIDRHPFKGEVRLKGSTPRTRYVEHWEVRECLGLSNKRSKGSVSLVQAYIRLKLILPLRKGDLLKIKEVDLKEDGIHVQISKTGVSKIFAWTPDLKRAVDAVKAARGVHISPYLFCTTKGRSYIDEKTGKVEGWDSMWQRFMKRVLSETQVNESFTEHDLRAKSASDAESTHAASILLAHKDSKVTADHYRRKVEVIIPAKDLFE